MYPLRDREYKILKIVFGIEKARGVIIPVGADTYLEGKN